MPLKTPDCAVRAVGALRTEMGLHLSAKAPEVSAQQAATHHALRISFIASVVRHKSRPMHFRLEKKYRQRTTCRHAERLPLLKATRRRSALPNCVTRPTGWGPATQMSSRQCVLFQAAIGSVGTSVIQSRCENRPSRGRSDTFADITPTISRSANLIVNLIHAYGYSNCRLGRSARVRVVIILTVTNNSDNLVSDSANIELVCESRHSRSCQFKIRLDWRAGRPRTRGDWIGSRVRRFWRRGAERMGVGSI